jgi:hypothetical protein
LHIPKSAGTSVSLGLENSKFTKSAWGLFDEVLFGEFTDFDSLDDTTRKRLIHLPGARIDPEWQAVSGHLSLPTINKIFPHHRVFTVLREPRTRLLSLYLFWRAVDNIERRKWGTRASQLDLAAGPFASFLTAKKVSPQTDNVIVRMLLGKHPLIPLNNFIEPASDTRLLRETRAAIRKIGLVGLTEDVRLNDKIGRFIGFSYELPRLNVTQSPVGQTVDITKELSVDAMEALLARCRLDRQIWLDVARSVFKNPAAVEETTFLNSLFKQIAPR